MAGAAPSPLPTCRSRPADRGRRSWTLADHWRGERPAWPGVDDHVQVGMVSAHGATLAATTDKIRIHRRSAATAIRPDPPCGEGRNFRAQQGW